MPAARPHAARPPDRGGEGAAVLAAQLPRLTALSDDERLDLETDLAHPSITGDRDAWLELLTRRWRDAGMLVPRLLTDAELAAVVGPESVAAFGDDLDVYDRVGPDADELAARRAGLRERFREATGRDVDPDDLPLVSVVVTAYRPGPWFATAIRALLDQTWSRLEVLVVDDASGPDFADEIARIAALDPRARVITRERNGGAYRARNLGLAQAQGSSSPSSTPTTGAIPSASSGRCSRCSPTPRSSRRTPWRSGRARTCGSPGWATPQCGTTLPAS